MQKVFSQWKGPRSALDAIVTSPPPPFFSSFPQKLSPLRSLSPAPGLVLITFGNYAIGVPTPPGAPFTKRLGLPLLEKKTHFLWTRARHSLYQSTLPDEHPPSLGGVRHRQRCWFSRLKLSLSPFVLFFSRGRGSYTEGSGPCINLWLVYQAFHPEVTFTSQSFNNQLPYIVEMYLIPFPTCPHPSH